MKRLVLLIVAIALLVGVGGFYYANVDKNYFELQNSMISLFLIVLH